mgnify:CR=1 FL=1
MLLPVRGDEFEIAVERGVELIWRVARHGETTAARGAIRRESRDEHETTWTNGPAHLCNVALTVSWLGEKVKNGSVMPQTDRACRDRQMKDVPHDPVDQLTTCPEATSRLGKCGPGQIEHRQVAETSLKQISSERRRASANIENRSRTVGQCVTNQIERETRVWLEPAHLVDASRIVDFVPVRFTAH